MMINCIDDRNVQLLVVLLKAHQIKRIIVSPGTTNSLLVKSLQLDDFFEMYSAIDERSAAYMACGMAAESREPVVITCTEATAARNYMPGLTEAFHRKLPVLAITGLHAYNQIGHLIPQVIDVCQSLADAVKCRVDLPVIRCDDEEWESTIKINKAIQALNHNGRGPAQINLPYKASHGGFVKADVTNVRAIYHFKIGDELPEISCDKIAIFVGAHIRWLKDEEESIDKFCENYNSVVFCDHSSNYKGKYRVLSSLLAAQKGGTTIFDDIQLLIHIGEESTDDATMRKMNHVKEVWRVSPDGEIRDTFKKLKNVFQMNEDDFFNYYGNKKTKSDDSYLKECMEYRKKIEEKMPKLPFSQFYVASHFAPRLPGNSVIHLGSSLTSRAWNLCEMPSSILNGGNAGCRGIDGTLSSLLGASKVNKERIHYGVVGDLAFFYDMTALGNKHLSSNIRILLVNNGGGGLLVKAGVFPEKEEYTKHTDEFVTARGHFENYSKDIVKSFVEELGFEYLKAESEEEFDLVEERFLTPQVTDKPMLLEVITNDKNDWEAFEVMKGVIKDSKSHIKETAKKVLGERGVQFTKEFVKKFK